MEYASRASTPVATSWPIHPGRVLKTEHLIYDRNRNLISSDTAFTSTSPKANLSGSWFESDPGFKNVRVTRPKGRSKQGLVLPGQGPGGVR